MAMTDRHIQETAKLLVRPNVLGYSASLQPRIRQGRAIPEEQAIRVYVWRKVPLEALSAQEQIPREIEGIPTDVVAIGKVEAQPVYDARVRPLVAGYSCGNQNSPATGTMGCIASDGKWEGILSNNHVLARASNVEGHKASLWEGIIQPGAVDGGAFPQDIVAFLSRWTDLTINGVNRVDRAFALLTRMAYRLSIQDVGLVKGLRQAEAGMEVLKVGRSSGLSEGRVFDTDATVLVGYGQIIGKALTFERQLLISPSISIPGDSGSLVLTRGREAIGLLFAGSDQVTVANRISDVLEDFGIEIVGAVG